MRRVKDFRARINARLQDLCDGREFRQGPDLHDLFVERADELLLPLRAADVAEIRAAIAQVLHGLLACQMLVALLEMDGEIRFGIVVIHVALDVEVDAAEHVDELGECLHIDRHILMHRHVQELFRRPHDGWRAARLVERRDAVFISRARDADPCVARDGQDAELARIVLDGQQQDRIRVLQRLAVLVRPLVAHRRAVVDAHDEHVRVAVEFRIQLRRARSLLREIRIMAHLDLRIDARAPVIEHRAEETRDREEDRRKE